MLKKLKEWWYCYNPFDISDVIDRMVSKFDTVECKLEDLRYSLEKEIAFYRAQAEFQKSLLDQIGDSLPDMVWFKDTEGKYIYANNAIKGGLLFDSNPTGKTDLELSHRAKLVFGDDKHTFGEKCLNSDKIVLQHEKPMRFLESGLIRGKLVYLEVYKNIVRDPSTGDVIGVCGTGRDLTEYMEAVRHMEDHCAKRCGETEIVEAFNKYKFEDN